MMLLDETEALSEIRALLASSTTAKLAVAFWGAGAIQRLGLDRSGLTLSILCNLESGACNPVEIRRIQALSNVTLKSHPKLHAKIYCTPTVAVLGSSNASANGLALEGDAAGGWAEANVRLEDPAALKAIAVRFQTLFTEGHDVLEADLERAEQVWKARAGMAPTGERLVDDLVTAYRSAPGHTAWKKVKLACWRDPLDRKDSDRLKAEIKAKALSSAVSAYSEWNRRIAGEDWVLDFDLTGKKAKFGGIWRVLPERVSPRDLRLVLRNKYLVLEAFGRLTFSKTDAALFSAITRADLADYSDDNGRNAVLDFSTAMALVSR